MNQIITKRKRIVSLSVALLIMIGIYFLGLNVGNGNISFSSSSLNGSLPKTLNFTSVNQEYQALISNYDGKLTATQLLNGIKHGLADAANDPYTEYFTAQEASQFNSELNNSFSGIGAELGTNQQNQIIIMSPLKGYPAAAAGLEANDVIADINGQSTSSMTVEQAVNAIRGKAGTIVTLTIISGGVQKDLKIKRESITVPSVSYKIINGNIGYISVITFADDTSSLIQQAANNMVSNHVKGIILDLRDNPGGLVSAAVATASEWLKPGQKVMDEKHGNVVIQTYDATGGNVLNGIPTVVLVNGGSASASEITAGALHDNHDAYIIGTQTFGKGVVQQLINLNDGSELKVTIASWYRPDGQDINHLGITPDQKVTQPSSSSTDLQLNAAEQYLESAK
ncbi:MAG: S41 family peptidase [Candidatus Saccharimonadales bacterium]